MSAMEDESSTILILDITERYIAFRQTRVRVFFSFVHSLTLTPTPTLTPTLTNTLCLSVSLSPSHPNHHMYSQSFRDSGVKKESSATPMAFFASTIIGQKQRNIIIPRNRGPYGVVYTLDFPGSAM